MTVAWFLFLVVAVLTAVSALMVVISSNIVRMAVWLLFTLLGTSLTYFLLGAEFVGTTQLIVYVGGTMVLLVFGVMLTAQGPFRRIRNHPLEWLVGGGMGLILFALMALTTVRHVGPAPASVREGLPGVGSLGVSLMGIPVEGKHNETTFLLPFEILSVHLLVALIAAAYLARGKRTAPDGESA